MTATYQPEDFATGHRAVGSTWSFSFSCVLSSVMFLVESVIVRNQNYVRPDSPLGLELGCSGSGTWGEDFDSRGLSTGPGIAFAFICFH